MLAVSRLLSAAAEGADVAAAVLREARALFDLRSALLVAAEETEPVPGFESEQRVALPGTGQVLVLLDDRPRSWDGEAAQLATAFAGAAASALTQQRLAEAHTRTHARQAALTRAAKTLNESLDLPVLLARICHEAAAILDADVATVYRGDADDGLTVAAAWGLPPETVGHRLESGAGLSGRVAQAGRAMLTNDYQRLAAPRPDSPFVHIESALAVPMHWESALRGVISVGYAHPHGVGPEDLKLLETFGELAAVACANASVHASLTIAARTDSLTGCLNHAALHEGLAREIGRCERGAATALSLILLDLDDFKRINEVQGHLLGDEVLRRVGRAVRNALRPYDLAARYGGDEFAIVLAEADEAAGVEVARRTIDRLSQTMGDIAEGLTHATAGVAEWSAGVTATELIARADRALLYGKQEGTRGEVQPFSTAPEFFRPGRFARREDRGVPAPPSRPASASHWPEPGAEIEERLRKRSRQLALANALGAKVAAMTGARSIMDAAVRELHHGFGYHLVSVVRCRDDDHVEAAAMRGGSIEHLGREPWSMPSDQGLIGRCLRERRPVLSNDVRAEPDYVSTDSTSGTGSELVVPLWVEDELWGVINVEESEPGAFDEDDLRLVETVSDQVGSALRSAFLYQQLERAYVETAEALTTALEGDDASASRRTRSLVRHVEAVGERLGMNEVELRDLRFGAVFHDLGKVAVPESVLDKAGPLDADEIEAVRSQPVVAERMLMPVDFLAGARRLVRHEHERWDGRGYPDALAAEEIPLGSRVLLACDALHAMTSERPYREAMTIEQACAELRRCAGTQFDPDVVAVVLSLVEDPAPDVTRAEQPAVPRGT